MIRHWPRPSAVLVWAGVAWIALGLAVAFDYMSWSAFWIAGALLLVVALLDAFGLWQITTPECAREHAAILPLGRSHDVLLRLKNAARIPLRLDVHDHHPEDWQVSEMPTRLQLKRGQKIELRYAVTPDERGLRQFPACDLRLHSFLRLWQQRRVLPVQSEARVYPNFSPLARMALISAEQATHVIGAHLRRRRGEGTEFQQLREYRVGDSLRQIDWKATQRTGKLISREYQQERNQQIVLWLDTGRRMMARDGALSHFDHVLNSALLLSYIALRQGDAVGMHASGGDARWFAPRRGTATIDLLMDQVFDLQPQPVATDYLHAAERLLAHQQRRALIILLTNARDEDAEDLLAACRLLQRRHLVMVASLREQTLDDIANASAIQNFDEALTLSATLHYLESRSNAHRALSANGAEVLDVTVPQLPSALVERYLAIKRAGML